MNCSHTWNFSHYFGITIFYIDSWRCVYSSLLREKVFALSNVPEHVEQNSLLSHQKNSRACVQQWRQQWTPQCGTLTLIWHRWSHSRILFLGSSFSFKPLISILDSTFERSNLRDGSLASVFAKRSPIGVRASLARAFSLCRPRKRDMRVPPSNPVSAYLLFSHICAAGIYYDVKGMVAVPTCVWRIILIVWLSPFCTMDMLALSLEPVVSGNFLPNGPLKHSH